MNPAWLNIVGGEWVIIIFAGLVLLLGTKRLPEAARKLGRASAEFSRARQEVQAEFEKGQAPSVASGKPAQSEREKLESICGSLSVDCKGKTDDQLRQIISEKMGAND